MKRSFWFGAGAWVASCFLLAWHEYGVAPAIFTAVTVSAAFGLCAGGAFIAGLHMEERRRVARHEDMDRYLRDIRAGNDTLLERQLPSRSYSTVHVRCPNCLHIADLKHRGDITFHEQKDCLLQVTRAGGELFTVCDHCGWTYPIEVVTIEDVHKAGMPLTGLPGCRMIVSPPAFSEPLV